MSLVSNPGPLLSFTRAGELDLLRAVVQSLIIPEAVHEELSATSGGQPLPAQLPWIEVRPISDHDMAERLPSKLHVGEREAIVLARELTTTLLIDDRAARREAERLRIPHFGSLRILAEAREQDFIPRVKPVLDRLIATGTNIGESLYEQFLNRMAER